MLGWSRWRYVHPPGGGHLPPVRIRLRPWFRSRRLVTLAMAVDAAVPHPAMQVDDFATVEVLRPTDEGEAAA